MRMIHEKEYNMQVVKAHTRQEILSGKFNMGDGGESLDDSVDSFK
jgi:hypothetical protein